jgi:hypothetical protein
MVVLSITDVEVLTEDHEVRVSRHVQNHFELFTTVTITVRATNFANTPRLLLVWPFPNPQRQYNSQQYTGDDVYGSYGDLVLGTTLEGCDLAAARFLETHYAEGYGFKVATLCGSGPHIVQWRWYGDATFAAVADRGGSIAAAPAVKTVTLHHARSAQWARKCGSPSQQSTVDSQRDPKNGLLSQVVRCRVAGPDDDIVGAINPEEPTTRSPSPDSNCVIS